MSYGGKKNPITNFETWGITDIKEWVWYRGVERKSGVTKRGV